MRLYILTITLLFAIGFTSCITDGESYNDLWSISVGEKLPEFSVAMSDGSTVSSNNLENKLAVIILFNTGCGDCRRELPELQKAYTDTSDDAVWVAISREEDAVSVEKYWQQNALTIPYSAQADRKIYELFASSGIPRIYISDNGIIKAAFGPDDTPSAEQLTSTITRIDR